jgi:uncharacterized protein YecE (DUF72 family)
MQRQHQNIYIGSAGWSYTDWQGVVYPLKTGRSFYALDYLMQFFNTVEINSTFYRIPNPASVAKWTKTAEQQNNFLFSVKLWQKFTHERVLDDSGISAFKKALLPMLEGQRLGVLLAQFPWSFKFNDASMVYLQKLADQFTDFPLAIEFRHQNWQNERVFDFFKEHGITFVNIDQPQLNACLPPTEQVTSDTGYIRLHGRNQQHWFNEKSGRNDRYNYLYSREELVPWQQHLDRIAAAAQRTFVIFNNHFHGQAIVNAFEFQYMLEQKPLDIPPHLLQHFPHLEHIHSVDMGNDPPRQRSLDLF